ncbi:MAG: hypothetical protein RR945_07545 [Erysipelotrichaceae bacterium]
MAKNERSSPSIAYLVEIIIVILFFAISSAICVQVFVASHKLSEDAQIRNQTLMKAQTVIEEVRSEQKIEISSYHYNRDWKKIKDKGTYILSIEKKDDHYQLIAMNQGKMITTIDFSLPYKVGESNE